MGITEKDLKTKNKKQVAFLLCLEPEEVICISKEVTERHSIPNRRSCSVCAVSTITEFYGQQFGWCHWIIGYTA